ncbi:hypothetical protein KDH_22700 [Dictyobacter sp. S3.2.2.5]|uniref:RDD domain-containing protein n=1 Tax=Dictyobacter halimunensis TaxID=3026934 RepID=A0ABQ6FMG6_9CHLR|nr:hypothetical protein KDH_22700 [Dictyobacter sp. S3.2.2.5]
MKHSNKLPNAAQRKEIKRTDPIWWFMRIQRVVNISLSILILSWTGYYLSTHPRLISIISSFFTLYMLLQPTVINHIMNERHWLRIGMRRLDILHNGESPQIQSVRLMPTKLAPLPLAVSLDWNRRTILITGITFLILLLLDLWGYIVWGFDGNGGYYVFAAIVGPVLLFLLLILLLALAYHAYFLRQRIEVNEEGIKTSYQGKECSMRWEDARLFAQYSSRATGGRQTFELSNEQVIVRWSKEGITGNYLLKAANNFADHNYYDTLIEQVNAQVAEHSHLHLLRLDTLKSNTKAVRSR